jgi:uncharacterized protein YfkK (UPF0435 family)
MAKKMKKLDPQDLHILAQMIKKRDALDVEIAALAEEIRQLKAEIKAKRRWLKEKQHD